MRVTPELRLPGVYFLPPQQPAGLGLPPLDVAAFVGFAERGPVHFPLPVDDLNTFRVIFGGDFALAREPGGRAVHAHLPQAVAGFFANGGRRCYIVRVAGDRATATRFSVPGIVALGDASSAQRAEISASSVGRWAAGLRLGTRLRATPLPSRVFRVSGPDRLTWQRGNAPQAIRHGDVLRLTFTTGEEWLFPIDEVRRPPDTSQQVVLLARQRWQQVTALMASPPASVKLVSRLTPDGGEVLDLEGEVLPDDRWVNVELVGNDVDRVQRGDVLEIQLGDDSTYLLRVNERRLLTTKASPPQQSLQAVAPALLRLPSQNLPLADLRRVERLRFDLLLQEGAKGHPALVEMAFNAGHPRYWGEVALLESSPLFQQLAIEGEAGPALAAKAAQLHAALQGDGRIEGAPGESLSITALAGLLAPVAAETELTCLPLGMPGLVTESDLFGPHCVGDDDLEEPDPIRFSEPKAFERWLSTLFVDGYLLPFPLNPASGVSARTLMTTAFDRHYIQDKRLRGIHSLLSVDEVALLSVPDAIHRAWQPGGAEESALSPPAPPALPQPPPCPPPGPFIGCLDTSKQESEEEAIGATAPEPAATQPLLPILDPSTDYQDDALLAIQQAALAVCQARSDMVAVFSLPLHYEKRQCIEWHGALRERLGLPPHGGVIDEAREVADLSYAAVFHPWLLVNDESDPERLRPIPPDGAVSGMIAARERDRQVWVAPANLPLQGVLGLSRSFSAEGWADLFDLGFNLVRHEPLDYRVMSAHTLSPERALLQLSVRRLMILLRKVAVERGMDFVFENNHARFREGVRVALTSMLDFLFDRGAFSGATAEQSYRVVTDHRVNTPQDIEQGRFVAQIQVAPSQPMEFLTVLLTRISEGPLLATEV